MLRAIQDKLTFSNVVSVVALVAALGMGTAYAAQLRKNSVGTKQIKNGAVTQKKLAAAAQAALKGADGKPGATGPTGPAGSARAYGTVDPAGIAFPARTFNATVRMASSGIYCIDPGPGIDPAAVSPQATIEFVGSGSVVMEFNRLNTDCMATEFEIVGVNRATNVYASSAFTFLVP